MTDDTSHINQNNQERDFVKSVYAQKFYKVSSTTLRRWASDKKIDYIVTDGGHHRYSVPINYNKSINNLSPINKLLIVYCRVSSRKQQGDLERQKKYLSVNYPNHKIISDVGSGINYSRPGFKWILQQLFKGNIQEVVVAHKDRFSRFGFSLFEWIF